MLKCQIILKILKIRLIIIFMQCLFIFCCCQYGKTWHVFLVRFILMPKNWCINLCTKCITYKLVLQFVIYIYQDMKSTFMLPIFCAIVAFVSTELYFFFSNLVLFLQVLVLAVAWIKHGIVEVMHRSTCSAKTLGADARAPQNSLFGDSPVFWGSFYFWRHGKRSLEWARLMIRRIMREPWLQL